MDFFTTIEEKWQEFCKNAKPVLKKCGQILRKTGKIIKTIWSYIYRLRAVFLAVPVAIGAIWLALMNMSKLPETVGINLLSNGEYSMMMSRELAVLCPFAVTALCIFLMLGARKTLYPWLISVFSLALPLLIYVTNVYPA